MNCLRFSKPHSWVTNSITQKLVWFSPRAGYLVTLVRPSHLSQFSYQQSVVKALVFFYVALVLVYWMMVLLMVHLHRISLRWQKKKFQRHFNIPNFRFQFYFGIVKMFFSASNANRKFFCLQLGNIKTEQYVYNCFL